ncbi:MAG: MFS transporter [Chloroflexi bacterium]|nr:MFS transporter [Chloroflexota bacterium]MCL5273603.1 MFS transporter [Chloroflexota bacterium]
MTFTNRLQLMMAHLRPDEYATLSAQRITHLTYLYDRLRSIPAGILDTAASTFLLLIAVQAYQAGSTEKALIAAGGNIGMLMSPLVVQVVERSRWATSRAAALISIIGAVCFMGAAAVPLQAVFVLFSVAALACTQALVPLLTQVYQDNYAPRERGRYYSRTLILRVAIAAGFASLAGLYLDAHFELFHWLLVAFSAAFCMTAIFLLRIPSQALRPSGSNHPLRAVSYVLKDKVFTWMLFVWMLMGSANLMMVPMRIEYLANQRYGINLDIQTIALLTSVIPSVVRLVFGPIWGWVFDRANFFILRIGLNIGFALSIAVFFAGHSMLGLVAGACIFGAATAGGDLTWSLWATKFAPPERVADYMSVHTFLTGLRGLLAPMIAYELLTTMPMGILSWVCSGLILLATTLLLPLIRYGRTRQGGATSAN